MTTIKTKDYFNGTSEADKKIIHLFMLERCTHKCKLCCNKLYNTDDIPVVTVNELRNAETVCLTGGEPFLLNNIGDFVYNLKTQYPNIKQVYVYTCGDSLYHWLEHNPIGALEEANIDGVNISPKNKYDTDCVVKIFENESYREDIIGLWSSRIYVFPNIDSKRIDALNLEGYESIKVMKREWQEDFEPDSGIFRRLPILFN